MKAILRKEQSHQIHKGDFNIDIHFPGLALNNHSEKRGLAQLGRFDHGNLKPGVLVGMHPHKNDEILSYIRTGNLVHEDTEGQNTSLSNTKLMMMNAGSGIYHQESIPDDGEPVDMLQIFMRPAEDNLKPKVQFSDLENAFSLNDWRLIAGPEKTQAPLQVNAAVSVFDARITTEITAPHETNKTYLAYLFKGQVKIEDRVLDSGDSLVYEDEKIVFSPETTTDLVLFELDKNKPFSRNGMYSGV